MAALTDAQIRKFAEMAAAIRTEREAAAQAVQDDHGSEDNNAGSDVESIDGLTVREIMDKPELSDLSEPEVTETPSWTISKKRKRETHNSSESKKEIPYAFHYNGATRRNMAPKILYPHDIQSLGRLTAQPWIRKAKRPRKSVYRTTDHLEVEDDELGFTRPFAPAPRVLPLTNAMPLKDRKRFFMYTPTAAMKQAMQNHVSEVHSFFPPRHPIGDCMLHPRPPPCHSDGSARQKISFSYSWRDKTGLQEVVVNYGIIALLVNSRLTAAQKEGWIEEAWHLSHLCGNWICCNWRHHTVENGPTNVSRNGCFGSSKPCTHKPPCMKEKKQKLILPVHKGRRTPSTLPRMTIKDVQKVDTEPEEATESESTSEEEAEEAIAEEVTAQETSAEGASDQEAEGEDGASGSGSNAEPKAVEVIVLDEGSETDSGSGDSETSD